MKKEKCQHKSNVLRYRIILRYFHGSHGVNPYRHPTTNTASTLGHVLDIRPSSLPVMHVICYKDCKLTSVSNATEIINRFDDRNEYIRCIITAMIIPIILNIVIIITMSIVGWSRRMHPHKHNFRPRSIS